MSVRVFVPIRRGALSLTAQTDRSLRCVQVFPSSARSWRAGVPRVEWIRARLGMLTRGVIRSVVPSQQ